MSLNYEKLGVQEAVPSRLTHGQLNLLYYPFIIKYERLSATRSKYLF